MYQSFCRLLKELNQLLFISSVDTLLSTAAAHFTRGPTGGLVTECVCLACRSILESSQPAALELGAVAAEGVCAGRLPHTEAGQPLELLAGAVHLAAPQRHAAQGLRILTAEGKKKVKAFMTRLRLREWSHQGGVRSPDPPVEQRTAAGSAPPSWRGRTTAVAGSLGRRHKTGSF